MISSEAVEIVCDLLDDEIQCCDSGETDREQWLKEARSFLWSHHFSHNAALEFADSGQSTGGLMTHAALKTLAAAIRDRRCEFCNELPLTKTEREFMQNAEVSRTKGEKR